MKPKGPLTTILEQPPEPLREPEYRIRDSHWEDCTEEQLIADIAACDREAEALTEKRRVMEQRRQKLRVMQADARGLLKRFQAGDYVVNSSGRHFWANTSLPGCLARPLWQDELDALERLVKLGIIFKMS